MKTWDLIKLHPNAQYRATLSRQETADSSFAKPRSAMSAFVEFETDTSAAICGVKENPFVDFASMTEEFEIFEIADLESGKSVDLRLFVAACCDSAALALEALQDHVDPNIKIRQGYSALHIAALKGRTEILELLLDAGAELDVVDDLGWTPFFVATRFEQHEAAAFLQARGAETTATICDKEITANPASSYGALLLAAASAGDLSGVRSAIESGTNVNAQNKDGWTALLESVKHEPEMLRLLIDKGADTDLATNRGYTPLMRAAGTGHERAVELLLACGADPAARDCENKTAYRLAMETLEYDCATLVGDALSEKVVREQNEKKLADGLELRPISHSDRMMVDMTRSTVGGTVSRLYLVFEDDSRLEGVRLIEELVLEIPLEHAEREVKAVGVPFEQH